MVRKDDEVTLKRRGEEEKRRGGADDGRSNQGTVGTYCTGKVKEAKAGAKGLAMEANGI
jgi:hypothetical protein